MSKDRNMICQLYSGRKENIIKYTLKEEKKGKKGVDPAQNPNYPPANQPDLNLRALGERSFRSTLSCCVVGWV